MINLKEFFSLGYYVSELDQFLTDFDQHHPGLSKSQQKEVQKYTRITYLRDKTTREEKLNTLWDKF